MNGFGLIFQKSVNKRISNYQKNKFSMDIQERGKSKTIFQRFPDFDLFLSDQNSKHIFKKDEYLVVGDIRIDNKSSIMESMQINSNDDYATEDLILDLFREKGVEGFSDLEGPFSFIIVNTKTNEIVGARDFFGQRPFHYYEDSDLFIISSELNPIFALGIQKHLRTSKLVDFIFSKHGRTSDTFFREIFKLNGGQYLTFNGLQKNKVKDFYNIPKKKEHNFTFERTVNKFRNIYHKVINDQLLNTSGPIFTTLSGGLDSSSISVLIDRYKTHQKKSSLSVHFESLNQNEFMMADETDFIDEVLQTTNLNHKKLNLSFESSSTLNTMKNNNVFDKPYSMVNGYIHHEMYKQCEKANSSVFFDGLFGDEIVSHGTFKLQEYIANKNFFAFFKELYLLKQKGLIFSLKHQIKINIVKPLIKSFKKFIFKGVLVMEFEDHSEIINENFTKYVKDYQSTRYQDFISEHDEQSKFLKSGVIENTLEQIDFITSRMNIDCRFPFLDKRILDFTINIPTDMKMKNGATRYYYREALKDILPTKVYARNSKGNLSFFGKRDIKENYRSIINEMGKSKTNIYKLIDLEKLKKKMDSNSKDSLYVIFFNIYSLDVWMKNNNFNL